MTTIDQITGDRPEPTNTDPMSALGGDWDFGEPISNAQLRGEEPNGEAESSPLPEGEGLGVRAQNEAATLPATTKPTQHAPLSTQHSEAAESAVARIVTLGRQINIDLPDDTNDLWDTAVELENRSVITDAQRGLCYLALKERLEHGEFVAELNTRNIARQRAHEAMKIAGLLLRMGSENSNVRLGGHLKPSDLVALPKKKVLALASVPQETLEQAMTQGELDLDDVSLMPVRELQDKVRQLKYETDHQRNQIAALEQKQAIAEHNRAASYYSDHAVKVREEALHSQAAASLAIGQIDATLSDLLDPLAPWKANDAGRAEQEASARLLWLAMGSAAKELAGVIERFRERLPNLCDTDVDAAGLCGLTTAEANQARDHMKALLGKADAAKADRAAKRSADQAEAKPIPKRGPGRPRGS